MPEPGMLAAAAAGHAALAARYEALRMEEERSMLDEGKIAGVVEGVLATLRGSLTAPEAALLAEVEELGRTIAATKQEIASLQVDDIQTSFIPSATDELDAIVSATASATNEILDACDTFERIGGTLPPEQATQMQDATTRIYEACSFQDITGQRITKIVGTLKTIETRIGSILAAFGPQLAGGEVEERKPAEPEPEGDSRLLNGPQLPGQGVDQAEIDRLLASFD